MKAHEYFELIQKVDSSPKESYIINIQGVGYIEMTKKEVIDRLFTDYSDARVLEFSKELKQMGVPQKLIAEKMGIRQVTFSQFMSGFVKSNKKVGTTLDFIDKAKKIALDLCSK